MTKTKSTKKALLSSVLALVMCVSMLVGSTFAWFTESITSTNNIIKSGRLDVELEYSTDATNWAPVGATTNIFKADALWEPGYTEVVYLKVSNKGNLALKYNLGVNIASEVGSVNVLGDDFKLSDYIYFGTKEGAATYADRDAAIAAVSADAKKISAGFAKESALDATGASEIITMVVYMPTTVGNEANYAEGEAVPTIKLGLNLIANQVEFEADGFNTNDYDKMATVDSEEELLAAIASNAGRIVLGSSFEVTNTVEIPANKAVIIDLAGCTISQTKACTESYLMISNKGSLVIKDSVGNGKISFTDSGLGDTGTSWASYTVHNSGTLVVDGGTIEHLGTQSGNLNNAIFSYSGSVTINGGVIAADYSRSLRQWNGDVTINGGTFKGQVWVQAQGDCNFTITDGSFRPAAYGNDGSSVYVTPNGKNVTVAISGGNFATKLGMATPIKGVTGGTFGADPSAFVADGYIAEENGDGTWGITKVIMYDPATMGSLYTFLPTLSSGDVLILPEGLYETTGTFPVPAGVTIKGAAGAEVIIRQNSAAQDDIFNCAGDVTFENITFESNRKGYAIADNSKYHDTDGDITVINCKFKGLAADKNYGVYKNLNGNLTVINCTFDNYNNAICGVSNGGDSSTVITGCVFTNINGEAIGYVTNNVPANFEADVIANNTGLTAENVIGWTL